MPLLHSLGVRRVLNMQDEYCGPLEALREFGMEQLRLPTVDHFEPTPEQITKGVEFITKAQNDGVGVYVNCQGGHGRSAAIVFAWLCLHEPHKEPSRHNSELNDSWRVRTSLHSQPHVNTFLKGAK